MPSFRTRVARSFPYRTLGKVFGWAYYANGNRTWLTTRWLGINTAKLPLDLWIYQEIITELRPALIIETGTLHGGSALFLASICDLLDHGEVVTVDIESNDARPLHPRIEYVTGSSTDPKIVSMLTERAHGVTLVILDSDHARDHVLAELRAYAPMVSAGSYVIVEDTNVNGHPVYRSHGPGPWEAVTAFLAETSDFTVDRERERLMASFNPRGYLRKTPA